MISRRGREYVFPPSWAAGDSGEQL